jgi:hypothetical protein
MQNIHAIEVRQARIRKHDSRHYKRKAASEDSESEASNQEEEPTKRTHKKQPSQGSRTHPNYSTNNRNQGPINQHYLQDQRSCPVHCERVDRNDAKWHTWWNCDLNPRGPKYKTRHHTKQPNNKPNDMHYHDFSHQEQQPQRQRNVTNPNRTTSTNTTPVNATSTNNNDRHYLDMFGFPD